MRQELCTHGFYPPNCSHCHGPQPEEENPHPRYRQGPLAEFDSALATITQRRGEIYGHPGDDFAMAANIKAALPGFDDERFAHIADMIATKLARLATTPTHVDSLVDIAGYARTWAMILERDYGKGTSDNQRTEDQATGHRDTREHNPSGGVLPPDNLWGVSHGGGGSPPAAGTSPTGPRSLDTHRRGYPD